MDRARFEVLLDAYGADFGRWPPELRAEGVAFAAAHADDLAVMLAQARGLDAALERARADGAASELLMARVLKRRPRGDALDRRALYALAACAVFGMLLGFGGGLLTPGGDWDDRYLATMFEAPMFAGEGG